MSIGENISALRRRSGKTQKELAAEIGVSESMVCKYEKNRVSPSIEIACDIAKALGCTVDVLVE